MSVQERFERALDELLTDVEADDHVLAAILCGSLAYDTVWEKSDIDLVLVCTDDKRLKSNHIALVEDDINIHVSMQTRASFKRDLDGSIRNTFGHSLFARAKLMFSKDPSIDELFDRLQNLGRHDLRMQVMLAGQGTVGCLYKAKKWATIKDDVQYTASWILVTARSLAEVVVSLAGELVDRESLVRATELEPQLFKTIYTDLFDQKVTPRTTKLAIQAIEEYLEPKAEELFQPILEYLGEASGQPRSTTEISHYFSRNYPIRDVVLGCEWLADLGVIEKASLPAKLTLHSDSSVDELAFFRHVGNA